jgi:hypothetical protein
MHTMTLHAQADLWQHKASTFAALFIEGEMRSPNNEDDRTDVLLYAVMNRGLPAPAARTLAYYGGCTHRGISAHCWTRPNNMMITSVAPSYSSGPRARRSSTVAIACWSSPSHS